MHGSTIVRVDAAHAGKVLPQCDGLLTTERGLPLMVTHQDCAPIVISNEAVSFVCVLHAGWRGVVAGILPAAIRLIETTVSNETQVAITLGPALGPCHFLVQEDVAAQFRAIVPASVLARDDQLFVDMHVALRQQATACGIAAERIVSSAGCTFCSPGYFSWRRDAVREHNLVTVAILVT